MLNPEKDKKSSAFLDTTVHVDRTIESTVCWESRNKSILLWRRTQIVWASQRASGAEKSPLHNKRMSEGRRCSDCPWGKKCPEFWWSLGHFKHKGFFGNLWNSLSWNLWYRMERTGPTHQNAEKNVSALFVPVPVPVPDFRVRSKKCVTLNLPFLNRPRNSMDFW